MTWEFFSRFRSKVCLRLHCFYMCVVYFEDAWGLCCVNSFLSLDTSGDETCDTVYQSGVENPPGGILPDRFMGEGGNWGKLSTRWGAGVDRWPRISPVKGSTDGLVFLRLGVLVGLSGCSSPSSKLDFMWYFLAGVLGEVELALDSFGDEAIDETMDEPSEKTDSELLDPPPGGFNTLLKFLASALSGIIS